MNHARVESVRQMGRRQPKLFETRFYRRLTLFRAVHVIVSITLVLTIGAAFLERVVEPDTFSSFGDAAWWAIVTVSTTGYGDAVPHTVLGKIVAAWVMLVSLALVPAVTAIVTALLIRKREEESHVTAEAANTPALAELVERLEGLEARLTAAASPRCSCRSC